MVVFCNLAHEASTGLIDINIFHYLDSRTDIMYQADVAGVVGSQAGVVDINHAFHLYYNVVCGSSFSRS